MTRRLKELNTHRSDLKFEGGPLVGASAEVEDREVDGGVDGAEAVELGEDPGAERGGEAHGLELAAGIGAYGERELVGGSDGLGAVELGAGIVGVGEVERGRVERNDAGGGDAEDPAVPAPPRVLDDEVAGEVLRLLGGGRGLGGGGGVAAGEVHGG
uniref:Similar to GRV2 (KATAMARI2) n=1 Tax=Arundo donax TaxID=35708 RepID=A0A0A9D7I2_ARUDO